MQVKDPDFSARLREYLGVAKTTSAEFQECKVLNHCTYMRAKPSLKIRTASAICWNYLGLFRDYGLDHIFLGIFFFQDRKLKLSASV